MSRTRSDSWTMEDDKLLAQVVLEVITNGGTQLYAFEEAGKRLNRTSSACAFRWNSNLRKDYKKELKAAKKARQQLKEKQGKSLKLVDSLPTQNFNNSVSEVEVESMDEHPEIMEELYSVIHKIEENYMALSTENERIKEENRILKQELINFKDDYLAIEKDYEVLLSIVERARERSVTSFINQEAISRLAE